MTDGLPSYVRLANEISIQFAHLDFADGTSRVAEHIHDFWDPRMVRDLLAYVDTGGDELDPLAVAAAEQLRQPA